MSPTRLLLACGVLLTLALAWLFLRDSGERGRSVEPAPRSADSSEEPHPATLTPPAAPTPPPDAEREVAPRPSDAAFAETSPRDRAAAWLRILARETREPVGGLEVRFALFDTRRAPDARPTSVVVTSDAEGRVDLREGLPELPDASNVLRIDASPLDPRLELVPGSFMRDELGATSTRALELLLAPRAAARLRGRALDARSGEPLRSLAFRAAAWNAAESDDPGRPRAGTEADGWRAVGFREPFEWLVTDDAGSFTAERDYPTGRLTLATLHEERTQVALDPAGTPVEARFTVGPTLLLDFDPLGSRTHDDFLAALYRAPSEAGLDTELREPLSPWSANDARAWGNASPVRPGPPPWVRLSSDELEHPLPSFLVLVSRDGVAKGSARVDALERYRTEPLFVQMEELCALSVSFRQPPEAGPRQCQLQLMEAGTGATLASRWGDTRSRMRFQGLAPGPYRLELVIERRETLQLEVSLPTLDPAEFLLPDLAPGELHTLEGEVLTDSGQSLDGQDGRARLWISAVVGGIGKAASLKWEDGRAQLRIPDLAAGEYRLFGGFQSGGFELEPSSPMATLPGPPVLFRVRDGGPQEELELWVLNPPTQGELTVEGQSEPFPHLRIHSSHPSDRALDTLPDGRPARHVLFGPYPAGAFQALRLRGEGRRTMQVQTQGFTRVDRRLTAEVTMLDGWSARISVTDEGGASLAGIVLALDGTPLRASDEGGWIQVEAQAKPERLSVVTPGWKLVDHHSWNDWGTVFENGEFTTEDGMVDVFLRRAP